MAEDCKEVQQQEIRRMEEEFEEPSLETDPVPESESNPQISPILKNAPSTPPPSQLPPTQILPQSSEVPVPFTATCDTTASFSTSFINQGVDLTAFSDGDIVPNNYNNQVAHTCNKCNSSFASPYELTVHWQEEHRDNFKCKRCERTFAKKHNLLRHNCVNACNICGQQFTRRYNLKLHMQIHGDGSKLHKCEYCGKSFTRRYTLLTHTRSHSGIKLFKCSICGKAFTRQHTLNLHMKRHVTKSSFYCRRCYAVFTDAVSLQLHRETEHVKTPKQPESLITTATSQSIQPSSNVVFPNSSPGYLYGTANVGPSSYHMDSFYQPTQQDIHNPFQNTYHGNRGSTNNPSQKEGDFGEKNLIHQESGHTASLEKHKWFEDERVGAFAKEASSRQETTFMTRPENEVVTVIDSGDESMHENSLYPDQSNKEREQVDQEPSERDIFMVGDKESEDVDTIDNQELEGEARRSLFPIDTSKHTRRTARSVSRPMRRSWQHGDKLVKETSEIRINVLDPSAMEEINPLLTPPRSSDTSTSRPTHNSSESGSPSTASLLESPSYSTRPFPASLKIAPNSPSAEKTCLTTQIAPQVACNDVDHEVSIRVPPPHSRVDSSLSYSSHHASNIANSDSSTSSSLLASQRMVKQEDGSQSDSSKWRCTHCGITFEESLMYVVHMGCHGQLDPFQCSMCSMLCQDRMAFTLHIIGGKHIKTQT